MSTELTFQLKISGFHRRNDLIQSKKHSNLPKNVQKIIDIVLGSLTIDALIILKP